MDIHLQRMTSFFLLMTFYTIKSSIQTRQRDMAGKTMKAEKIDDQLLATLKFAASYGTFLTELATPLAQEPVLWAKTFLQAVSSQI